MKSNVCRGKIRNFGEQVDEFTSTYRKDFKPKSCEIPKKCYLEQDYPDPLSGPYTDYLLPESKMSKLKELKGNELAGAYYAKLLKRTPKLIRHLEKDVDQDYIGRLYKDDGRSIYQIDFCRLEDGYVSKKSANKVQIVLPDDWGDPPMTIQKKSYRDPRKILMAGESVRALPFKEPRSELVQSDELKKILKIRTGETEYEGNMGALGAQIVKDKYYGEIELLPNEIVS